MRPRVRVEEEVGRGEAVGAVWALTGGIHDTTARCVRDSELVRMSKVTLYHSRCLHYFAFPQVYTQGALQLHLTRLCSLF